MSASKSYHLMIPLMPAALAVQMRLTQEAKMTLSMSAQTEVRIPLAPVEVLAV
jgi:hypothetical protein